MTTVGVGLASTDMGPVAAGRQSVGAAAAATTLQVTTSTPEKAAENNSVISVHHTSELDSGLQDLINVEQKNVILRICRSNPLTHTGKNLQLGKMLTLILVPITALFAIILTQLTSTAMQMLDANNIRDSVQFSIEVGLLIHSLQRERDWTALYLSSQGAETKIFLRERYPVTDAALDNLSDWLDDGSSDAQFASKQALMDSLETHRALLSEESDIIEEIYFYTNIINTFFDWMYDAVKESENGSIWRRLVAYILLVLSKEDTGVERTLGGIFFSKGHFETFDQYLWYLSKYYVSKTSFMIATKFDEMANALSASSLLGVGTNVTSNIEIMRNAIRNSILCNFTLTGSWLLSNYWFDNMTILIDAMYDSQVDLAEDILMSLAASSDRDMENIAVNLAIICVIVIIAPIIAISTTTIITDIQRYATTLATRTKTLNKERKRADSLLYQMLPRSVAEQLKRNESVSAETFDMVTVFFSDIVGFTKLSAQSPPMEIVRMLNDLYTCFDARIESYDVYKVETIGDAYMVASGVPLRNGPNHVIQVATMALDLLHNVTHISIPHMPELRMELRAGIHSGAVVAGVVGTRMPRYCLFGDTVNTASRMETSGESNRIHITQVTYDLLCIQNIGYQFVPRDTINIKGKGQMQTYFLTKKAGFLETLPCMPNCRYESRSRLSEDSPAGRFQESAPV